MASRNGFELALGYLTVDKKAVRADQRGERFYRIEELLLAGVGVSQACRRVGASRAWFYKLTAQRSAYVSSGFAERRLHARPWVTAQLLSMWRDEVGPRRSVATILEYGRKYCRNAAGALDRRHENSDAVATHTARRLLKGLGAWWCPRRRRWSAQEASILAQHERQAASRTEPPARPLLTRPAVSEKLRGWLRRGLPPRLDDCLQSCSPATQRDLKWRVLRSAGKIARGGTHSSRAHFWRDDRNYHPPGGNFTCDWALPTKAVMRIALHEAPRPFRAPVAPGPDYRGAAAFEGDAPVPSAFAAMARALLFEQCGTELGCAIADAIEATTSALRPRAQALPAKSTTLDAAWAHWLEQRPTLASDCLADRLARWWAERAKPPCVQTQAFCHPNPHAS